MCNPTRWVGLAYNVLSGRRITQAEYYQNGNNSACELSTLHYQLSTIPLSFQDAE
ncbi:MAG: hypothetical protein LBC20_07780 [Planctomycetaceae bacterium]|nr:hypothetical protein [Planctomycetaceae bacterium]